MTEPLKIRTRFAPSPTGDLHLGNMRAAIWNYCFAKQHNGLFVLRVEDTDKERSTDEFITSLFEDMRACGIDWDEGPQALPQNESIHNENSSETSYYQSNRQKIYHYYFEQIKSKNLIYPCFCDDKQLELQHKAQLAVGKPPRYSGICSRLSTEEIAEKIKNNEPHSFRFKVPKNKMIDFIDGVHGEKSFNSNDIGDFIIKRSRGDYPFIFTNTLDDALMQITDAMRGDDHLPNTPRQILIQEALGFLITKYAHLPMIFNQDGKPLSKRDGNSSVRDLLNQGYLPDAIVNYMVRLGCHLKSSELLPLDKLVHMFDISHISRAPARLDLKHLQHWQKLTLQRLGDEDFLSWLESCNSKLRQLDNTKKQDFARWARGNAILKNDVTKLLKIVFGVSITADILEEFLLKETYPQDIFFYKTASELIKTSENWDIFVNEMKTRTKQSGKNLFMPIRLALTAQNHGAELAPLLYLIPRDDLAQRLLNFGKSIQLIK